MIWKIGKRDSRLAVNGGKIELMGKIVASLVKIDGNTLCLRKVHGAHIYRPTAVVSVVGEM